VTLATFYRHFPSKQDLVVAYLRAIHDSLAERAASTADGLEARELITATGAEVLAEIGHEAFRGCAFINAASEFEDPTRCVRSSPSIAAGTWSGCGVPSPPPATSVRATPPATS
jgi:AcrR family transcriptional regulator